MPYFTLDDLAKKDFCTTAWTMLKYGMGKSADRLLFPADLNSWKGIMYAEKLRNLALADGGNLAPLMAFEDFRTFAGERRPAPTQDQWLWLYMHIGERHRELTLNEAAGIMTGRDAILAFLESIPDKKFWVEMTSEKEDMLEDDSDEQKDPPLKYDKLEQAIQDDTPAKLSICRLLCRGVTSEMILQRARILEKGNIVASLLKEYPLEQRIRILIDCHTEWNDPTVLFQKALPTYVQEIGTWRDPYGNGFFWYLLRRPILIQNLIETLPPEILATFTVKNQYGISPEMLWPYYRPRRDSKK